MTRDAQPRPRRDSDVSQSFSRAAVLPVPPTDYGKYTLLAKLGQGGMAEVLLAVSSGLGGFRKLVVIKRLHSHLLEDAEFVNMFMDEARLAARLNHPNVVQTYEVGQADDLPYLAMEHIEGLNLFKVVRPGKNGRPLPAALALEVMSGALKGIHYAHELQDLDGSPLGVVHRDVSPSNVVITYGGDVKILDFGIAKAATKLVVTRAGMIKGKFSYMAPEQARALHVDRRADVWSAGVCLYEAVTSKRLFHAANDIDTLAKVLRGDVSQALAELDPDAEVVEPVLRKALALRPDDRYATADEMRRDLDRVRRSLDYSGPELPGHLEERFGERHEHYRAAIRMLVERMEDRDAAASVFGEGAKLDSEFPTVTAVAVTPTSDSTSRIRGVPSVDEARDGSRHVLGSVLIVLLVILTGILTFLISSHFVSG